MILAKTLLLKLPVAIAATVKHIDKLKENVHAYLPHCSEINLYWHYSARDSSYNIDIRIFFNRQVALWFSPAEINCLSYTSYNLKTIRDGFKLLKHRLQSSVTLFKTEPSNLLDILFRGQSVKPTYIWYIQYLFVKQKDINDSDHKLHKNFHHQTQPIRT